MNLEDQIKNQIPQAVRQLASLFEIGEEAESTIPAFKTIVPKLTIQTVYSSDRIRPGYVAGRTVGTLFHRKANSAFYENPRRILTVIDNQNETEREVESVYERQREGVKGIISHYCGLACAEGKMFNDERSERMAMNPLEYSNPQVQKREQRKRLIWIVAKSLLTGNKEEFSRVVKMNVSPAAKYIEERTGISL